MKPRQEAKKLIKRVRHNLNHKADESTVLSMAKTIVNYIEKIAISEDDFPDIQYEKSKEYWEEVQYEIENYNN